MSSKIAHVTARDFNVLCSIYDDKTKTNPKTFNFASKDLEKNVENILNQLTKIPNLHSVIFTLFDFNDFAFGYKLRLKCKKFCDEKKIRNVFIYNEILHASAGLLTAENLHISPEETFCLIIVYDTYVSVYSIFHYGFYCILQNLDTFDSNDIEAFRELEIRFMSEKIIITYFGNAKTREQAKAAYEIVKSYFKNKNNIFDINTDIKQFIHQSCLINAQTYLIQNPHTFAIMPSVFDTIGVIFKSKLESSTNILRASIMYIDGALPSSSLTTKKLVDDLIVYKFIPPNNFQILEKIDTSKIRNLDASLFLEINSSCFYKFDVTLEKYITHAYSMPLKTIPKLLKEAKKDPLIFFEKNVFEIGLTKGNKYCILEGKI